MYWRFFAVVIGALDADAPLEKMLGSFIIDLRIQQKHQFVRQVEVQVGVSQQQ